MVDRRATIIPYSYSEDQNKQFESLINIQGPTEAEKHPKMSESSDLFGSKMRKNTKVLVGI